MNALVEKWFLAYALVVVLLLLLLCACEHTREGNKNYNQTRPYIWTP